MLAGPAVKIVGEALDGPGPLTLAKRHKQAIVLPDPAIPVGKAFDLVAKLTTTQPATKFVFVTEVDNPTYMARAQAAGASDFLLRGVSRRELVAFRRNTAIRLSSFAF